MFHYTYQIANLKTGKKYIGVRSSLIEPISDIGIFYFSSSSDKSFKEDQRLNPQDYTYEVLSTHGTRIEALKEEVRLHELYDVCVNENFYNQARQTGTGADFTGRKHTEEALIKISNASKSRIIKDETREKCRLANLGRKATDCAKKKMSEAKLGSKNKWYGKSGPMKGKKMSEESRRKMSESRSGEKHHFYGKSMSDDAKKKMSEAKLGDNNPKYWQGKKRSEETKRKISEAKKGKSYKQDIIECPHCGKKGGNATMPRWHFDNCKSKNI
jgi:hypothetical protein